MAFITVGTLKSEGAPVLRREILANSITVVVEDSVKLGSGFVALGTAGASVFGHVVGIGTDKGVGLNTTGVAGAAIGSFVNTFLTASDNQTVGKVRAEVDISQETLRSELTSGTLGTTTGSNLLGYYLDLTDEDTLDETSATTGTAQYFNWGVSPTASTRIIVNINESRVFNHVTA
jgi:hypothetical protein